MKRIVIIAVALLCGICANAQKPAAPPADGKELTVRKLSCEVADPAMVPEIFAKEGISYQGISVENFKDKHPLPVLPVVSFAIAYTDDAIVIHYRVSEPSVRAVAFADNQAVWKDACCEFFSAPADDGYYYNLEANCIGNILIEGGMQMSPRTHPSAEVMKSVKRWASLGNEPFDTIDIPTAWQLALIVPYRVFYFNHDVQTLEGKTLRANFYKCGDMLPWPHTLSWSPIYPPATNFHCPDFFGTVHFE